MKHTFPSFSITLPILLVLLAMVFATSSCKALHDDLTNCPGLELRFSYLEDDGKEHLQDYLEKIDLFVYDDAGKLVQKQSVSHEQILNKPSCELKLLPGKYRCVALGNILEKCESYDVDNYTTANVQTKQQQTPTDMLYIGQTWVEVEPLPTTEPRVLELFSQHIRLIVGVASVNGNTEVAKQWVEAVQADGGYSLELTQSDKQVSFERMQSVPGNIVLPLGVATDKASFISNFFTLRFTASTSQVLSLTQGKNTKVEVKLSEYIKKYSNEINIEKQEAVVPIYFFVDPLSLSVSVQPWSELDVHPIV